MHRIQDYIGEIWKSYKAGKTDLPTAAITTNAAFDLVRQAEAKILDAAPKLFNRKRSWDTIAIIIFYADAFEQGVCPEAKLGNNEALRITPFDNFIYLSTARVLMKFVWLSKIPADGRPGYPMPTFPLRFGYVSRPELLGTPEMDKKEEEDKILTQFIVDHHFWSEFKINIEKIRKPAQDAPMEDEFSKGLENLTRNGVLSVALVFAAQIYLDIQAIMGQEVGNGHRDLLTLTKEIDDTMNLKDVGGAWDVGGSGERWHEKDVSVVLRIKQVSLDWILRNPLPELKKYALAKNAFEDSESEDCSEDPSIPEINLPGRHTQGPKELKNSKTQLSRGTGEFKTTQAKHKPPKNPEFSTVSVGFHKIPKDFNGTKVDRNRLITQRLVDLGHLPDAGGPSEEHEENARRLNIKPIKPSEDLKFLFTSNPIYCGLVAFNLLTDYEAAGIALCNWHKTIWSMAHLYNALRQMSVLAKSWPEMEGFFELHLGDLFAGQLPQSPDEFYARFALSIGVSATTFARNRNDNSLKWRKNHVGTQFKTSSTADIFRPYFDKKVSLETCLVHIEALWEESGRRRTFREKATQSRLTSLQFLEKFKEHSVRAIQLMQFDYITLSRQCTQILKTLRQKIGLKLGIPHAVQNTENSSDQFYAIMVYRILEEVKEARSLTRSATTSALNDSASPQLMVAGQTLSNFLAVYKPQDLISNFNNLLRTPRSPSGMVPNHWHISIRHVPLNPPGDLVFIVNPEAHYVHTEGHIQTVEGQIPGHTLNPKSLITLQVIAKLIMKAFVQGMGAGTAMARQPWSWSTNDVDFARRITKVMRDLGVQEEALLNMSVADAEVNKSVDGDWDNLRKTLVRAMHR